MQIFVLGKSEINLHLICIHIRAAHNNNNNATQVRMHITAHLRICLRMRRQILNKAFVNLLHTKRCCCELVIAVVGHLFCCHRRRCRYLHAN